MEVVIAQDIRSLGREAAEAGAALIRSAIARRGAAAVIVATGTSQFQTLAALVDEEEIDWSSVTGFHLDEYIGLPMDHPASFRGYLKQRFVDRVPLGAFHYIDGETADPVAECYRLGRLIEGHEIDVAFVGIGENGHLAFNDPPADFQTGEPYLVVELDEACRRQQLGEGWFDNLGSVPRQAISMSVRQILKSNAIICSVPDERKATAAAAAVEGPVIPQVPASILQDHSQTRIYLDPPAASRLERRQPDQTA